MIVINRLLQLLLPIVLLIGSFNIQAQNSAEKYFKRIRNNEAALTAFMSRMPKGGDLHNHYSGAIYGESYFKWLSDAGYCINPVSLQFSPPSAIHNCPDSMVQLNSMQSSMVEDIRGRLLRLWSIKDYDQVHNDPREDHFFSTFGNFGVASWLNYSKGLIELKERAITENLSYIETMLNRVEVLKPAVTADLLSNQDSIKYYNHLLISLGQKKDNKQLQPLLVYLYNKIMATIPIDSSAEAYNRFVDSIHVTSKIDDNLFTMRYQTFITRTSDPLITLINLIASFHAVDKSKTKYLVGVNIVAPEDHSISMRDYWLHMYYFKFCNVQYNNRVSYAMHAGELTEGYVQPEQLTYHISDAVYNAGARRIGHGVDIAYEKDNYELMDYMSKKGIPVEINLSSNEFILGVKDDRHPILLYKAYKVPIVISTDDAGVSRSSLTEQYVLLAKRYKDISFGDIKSYVFNSIAYSFMNKADKEKLKNDLLVRFKKFENYFANIKE